MGTLNGKYTVGEPVEYTSIYGYSKYRYPVLDQNGTTIGAIKEELILDGEKNVVSKTYYTRNLTRPYGQKRFYESSEALILAFGGEIARKKTVLKSMAGGKKPRKPAAKAAPVKKPRLKAAATAPKKGRIKKVA